MGWGTKRKTSKDHIAVPNSIIEGTLPLDEEPGTPMTPLENAQRETFMQKTCCLYRKDEKSPSLCTCGRARDEHMLQLEPGKQWYEKPTNAFGEIEFHGATERSRAKYLRLSDDTDMEKVINLLLNEWQLDYPELLVSVTGGAKDFKMKRKLQDMFSEGLRKVTRSADTWVITGGTNTGVMKQVGQALKGASRKNFGRSFKIEQENHVYCIGVATWGIINERQKLMDVEHVQKYQVNSSAGSKGAYLDSNHTHFLLIDDGRINKYGGEIQFRSNLEACIAEGMQGKNKVPTVLLVVEGGMNTIKTIYMALTSEPRTPVVIIKNSGRAADLLTECYDVQCPPEKLEHLEDVIDEISLKELIKKTFPEEKYEERIHTAFLQLVACLKLKNYITVCQMEEGAPRLDEAILQSLVKCQRSRKEMLELAIRWNSIELAITYIFDKDKEFEDWELEIAMDQSLLLNRVEFVDFLSSRGVDIISYLTVKKLTYLYEQKLKYSRKKDATKSLSVMKHLFEDSQNNGLMDVQEVLTDMLGSFMQNHYFIADQKMQEEHSKEEARDNSPFLFKDPYQQLFLWAVLCNQKKMATYFLRKGKNPIAAAVVGFKMFESMACFMRRRGFYDEKITTITDNILEFKSLALTLLKQCYEASEKMTEDLLTCELKEWGGETCLSLAASAEFEEFVAHSCCQQLLTEKWNGGLALQTYPSLKILAAVIFPPIILAYKFTNEANYDQPWKRKVYKKALNGKQELAEERQFLYEDLDGVQTLQPSGCAKFCTKIRTFYSAPITKFWTHVIAYLIFLVLFASVVLIQLPSMPSSREWIVILCAISLTTEEIRQFLHCEGGSLSAKFTKWRHSKWNICDFIGIVLFLVALTLRFNSSTLRAAHVIYSLDIMFWIIRLLEIFSIDKNLGPYVVMIGRMTIDMMHFLFILAVFLLAYGVTRQSILVPDHPAKWELIWDTILIPYFQVFGELFLQGQDSRTIYSVPKPRHYNEVLVTMSLAFFLLVANTLLLNLLIAIFNNTYEDVKVHSMQLWKFQRYHLIVQYSTKPSLMPPFIIFEHIAELLSACCKGSEYQAPDCKIKRPLQVRKWDLMFFESLCLSMYLESMRNVKTAEQGMNKMLDRLDALKLKLKEGSSAALDIKKSIKALEDYIKDQSLSQSHGDYQHHHHDEDADADEDMGEDTLPEAVVDHYKAVMDSRRVAEVQRLQAKIVGHAASAFGEPIRRKTIAHLPSQYQEILLKAKESSQEVEDQIDGSQHFKRRYTVPHHPKRARMKRNQQESTEVASTLPPFDTMELPNLSSKLHQKCRTPFYPGTFLKRYPVPDFFARWEVEYTEYCPPLYSSESPHFKETDLESKRNPRGRTGLQGCGHFEKLGSNLKVYWIVTRQKSFAGEDQCRSTQQSALEFLAVKIEDEYGIPSGMASSGAKMPAEMKIYISEMMINSGLSIIEREEKLDKIIDSSLTVYQGYVDDARNTDNAWLEISIEYFHDSDGYFSNYEEAQEEENTFFWRDIHSDSNVYDNHFEYLACASEMHKLLF